MWSPRLDDRGNSARCLQMAQKISDKFRFHIFSNIGYTVQEMGCDDLREPDESEADSNSKLEEDDENATSNDDNQEE